MTTNTPLAGQTMYNGNYYLKDGHFNKHAAIVGGP